MNPFFLRPFSMNHLKTIFFFALILSANCGRGRKKQEKRVTPYRRTTDRHDGGSSTFKRPSDDASERDLSQRDGEAIEGARRRLVDKDSTPLIDVESNRRLLPESTPLRQSFIRTVNLDSENPQQPGPSHGGRGGGGGGHAGE